MKKFLLNLSLLLFFSATIYSQQKKLKIPEVIDLKKRGLINSNSFKFGASLGFNVLSEPTYDPVLSLVDNSLKLQRINPCSFLLSTVVFINPSSHYSSKEKASITSSEDITSIPSWVSFIATINLAQFSVSQSASFNKKIDGGLGIGFRLSDDFHVGITAEMISVRQLRNYVINGYEDRPIIINNEALNALDISDSRLFTDKYHLGFSLKFIYLIVGE